MDKKAGRNQRVLVYHQYFFYEGLTVSGKFIIDVKGRQPEALLPFIIKIPAVSLIKR
jgi:hypothetical protein